MALCDYRLCDMCEGKVFYDAGLNYEFREGDDREHYPPFRVAGEELNGDSLDYLGDWAVICNDCAKTHKCIVVPTEEPRSDGE